MNITKEELIKLIDLCWTASQEATLPGYVSGLVSPVAGQLDLVRYKTYETLLACLLPRGTQYVAGVPVKEPWEE